MKPRIYILLPDTMNIKLIICALGLGAVEIRVAARTAENWLPVIDGTIDTVSIPWGYWG